MLKIKKKGIKVVIMDLISLQHFDVRKIGVITFEAKAFK
jgi:hypothetical protein